MNRARNHANRLDGILDHISESTRAGLKDPSIDELIENAVDSIKAWDGDLHGIDPSDEELLADEWNAAWNAVCNLKVIVLLAKLKEGYAVTA